MRRIVLLALLIMVLMSAPVQGAGPFNIAFDDWIGFVPFFVAKEKNYYDGVQVGINLITKEDERREGLASGRFQMICETMGMFQTNRRAPDYPGRLVFAIGESRGADGVLAAEEIISVEDLKGRTVVGPVGLPSHLILAASLARRGMTINDLNFLNMPMSEAATAFLSQKADALCAYEPHLSASLKARSGSHLLLSSRDFPGAAVDVAIVKEDTISSRREDLEKIYEGWTMAVAYIKENPDEGSRLIAKAVGIDADEFRRMSAGLIFFGKTENENYFGVETPCCESDALRTFNLISRALEKNGLTTAVSPGSERIDYSIVGTVRAKRSSPRPEKLP